MKILSEKSYFNLLKRKKSRQNDETLMGDIQWQNIIFKCLEIQQLFNNKKIRLHEDDCKRIAILHA